MLMMRWCCWCTVAADALMHWCCWYAAADGVDDADALMLLILGVSENSHKIPVFLFDASPKSVNMSVTFQISTLSVSLNRWQYIFNTFAIHNQNICFICVIYLQYIQYLQLPAEADLDEIEKMQEEAMAGVSFIVFIVIFIFVIFPPGGNMS